METTLPDDASILPDTAIPPDAWQTDLPTGPACSSQALAVPVPQWTGKMVLCDALSGGADQCNASGLCNTSAGWHLCTASEYQANGGKKAGGPKAAWLQTCIRDGSAPFAPNNQTCKCLPDLDALPTEVSWNCVTGGGWKSTNAFYIGVISQTNCARVGENVSATEAHWEFRKADATVHAAVCCHN